MVTTFAGSGEYGHDDGQGRSASFYYPFGLTLDPLNNVFIADYGNQQIRKISSSGEVSTFTGSGVTGLANGKSSQAAFNFPISVASDSSGTIYVADLYNHALRKVNVNGDVSTLAGDGVIGQQNGYSARFNEPWGVAVDPSNNVYVADRWNNQIRKISPDGFVTTFAGSGQQGNQNGSVSSASFYWPFGIALDKSGNLYISERGNGSIRKISANNTVTTLTGNVMIRGAAGVAVDSVGNVFVVDEVENKILKITPSGVMNIIAGSGNNNGTTNGPGKIAKFEAPFGVAVDSMDNLFIADRGNNLIRKITFVKP
jgi:hypothetical protein